MSDSQQGKRSDPISIQSGGGGSPGWWDRFSQSAPTKFFGSSLGSSHGSSSSPPSSPIGNSPPTPTDKSKSEWDKFVRKKSFIIDSSGCGW